MRILLVEDSKVVAKMIKAILEKNGFEVVTTHAGREALELLKSGALIDLIISDIMMPDIDGLLLLKYIRNSLRYKTTPVILTSALSDQETIVKAMKLGISSYLVKPVVAENLIPKINQALKNTHGAILIVDDEEIIRNLLKNVVEREGFRVETASDGVLALEVLQNKRISLIISDIKMPNMTGTELLIESKTKYPDIPILLMTGFSLNFTKEQAIQTGADDYITKPFKNIEVVNRIRSCLTRAKKETVKQ